MPPSSPMTDLAIRIRDVTDNGFYGVIFGVTAAENLPEACTGDSLGRICGSGVEVVALANHGLEICDPAGWVVGVGHQCRHSIVGGTDVDCLAPVPDRLPGIVLNRLRRIIVDRLSGLCVEAHGPVHFRERL